MHHFSKVCKSLQQCSLCFVIVESPLQRKVHVVLCMANKTLYNGSTKLTTEQAERDKGHLWATVKEEYNKSPVNGKRLWKSSIRICTDLKRDRCLFQCQVHNNVKLELKGVLLQERYSWYFQIKIDGWCRVSTIGIGSLNISWTYCGDWRITVETWDEQFWRKISSLLALPGHQIPVSTQFVYCQVSFTGGHALTTSDWDSTLNYLSQ